MKKKFITNLGLFLLLNLIIKPVYVFGIDRVVQNKVGVASFGTYFSLFSIAIIFQIFLDLGIESFIRREISRYPEKAAGFLTSIGVLKLLLFFPYVAICFVLAWLSGIEKSAYTLLILVMFNQFLASFILYLRSNLGGYQLFKTESFISVLDRTLMILIVGTLLLHPVTSGNFKIEWFVLAQTFAYLVTLFAGLALVLRNTEKIRPEFRLATFLPVLRQLKPYALLVLLQAIYYRIEPVWLHSLLPDGDVQTGIYAHSFRLLDFMSNYALLFPILLLPIFSKTLHQKESVDGLLRLSVILLIVPSLAVLTPAILYREVLFGLLYPTHVTVSANAFAILTISYLGMCVSYTFGALLTANGNLKQLNRMAALAVLVSTLLNLLLIPKYKVMGAVAANAAVQLLTLFIHIGLVSRIFRIRPNLNLIVRLLFYMLFLVGFAVLIKRLDLSLLPGSVTMIIASLLFAMAINLLSPRDIYRIIRSE